MAPAGFVIGPSRLKTVRTPISFRALEALRMALWKLGANRNVMPRWSSERPALSGVRSTRTPSASSTSALPVRLETARLPCLATATPHEAVTIATVVEMLNLTPPAGSLPPVPHVSMSGERRVRSGGTRWRIARAMPAISSGVSPFMRSEMASAAICAAVASPARICSMLACARSSDRSSRSTARPIAVRIMRARPPARRRPCGTA